MQAAKIWNHIFTRGYLTQLYSDKIEKKPSIGMDKISPLKFKEELQQNIDIIIRKVRDGSYHFTRYRQLLFTKGATKLPRTVCVPTLRDKLTLAALNEVINEVYGAKCKTEMPQVIINDIEKNISEYECFLKLDIRSFYSSIDQGILLKIIKRKIRKKEIIGLIEKSIKTSSIAYPIKDKFPIEKITCGIPEGLSISNALANIYLIDVDKKYREKDDIKYFRYVDDILVLVDRKNFFKIKDEIVSDIGKMRLEINEKKDEGIVENGFEYLGYVMFPDHITVRRSSVLKIEQSIEDLIRELHNKIPYLEWKLNLKITGFILENHKYGWMFFYSQITDQTLLFHLDDLVDKLLKRYELKTKIRVKRFVRTYMEIRQALHVTRYIPNIDKYTFEDKRNLLAEIYGMDLNGKTDESIEYNFRRVMSREIRDIEKDIQNIS